MTLYEIIESANDAIWVLPILRQYKSKYFYFFYVLGTTDLINNILLRTLSVYPMHTYLFSSYVLLLSVLALKRKLKVTEIIGYFLFCGLFLFNPEDAMVGVFAFHCIVFYHLADIFANEIFFDNVISSFSVILLLYEATIVLKAGVYLVNASTGIMYFYISTVFTTFIAIYFIIYRKDTAFRKVLSRK